MEPDNDGALVLSEFAGAADELKQAWLVNPYDINGMKAQMLEAYNADEKDLARRMKAMRKTIAENDVAKWSDSFLTTLRHARRTRAAWGGSGLPGELEWTVERPTSR